MASLKILIASIVIAINTIVGFSLMMPVALVKLVLPLRLVRSLCDRALNAIAATWIAVNGLWIQGLNHTQWRISGVDNLDPRGWYLLVCNHQSWVDIVALQKVFLGRIPFLKFFIKHELIYVPFLGLAWWALDFPFMKRRGGATLQQDLETARKSCEKFRLIPTSVISFVEGTRFTPEKHAQQKSPYQHLLKPKGAGIGIAMETMGDMFTQVLNVTIVYPQGVPTFVDLMAGRCQEIVVEVQPLPVPDLRSEPNGPLNPMTTQRWISRLWKEKDARIEELRGDPHQPSA